MPFTPDCSIFAATSLIGSRQLQLHTPTRSGATVFDGKEQHPAARTRTAASRLFTCLIIIGELYHPLRVKVKDNDKKARRERRAFLGGCLTPYMFEKNWKEA